MNVYRETMELEDLIWGLTIVIVPVKFAQAIGFDKDERTCQVHRDREVGDRVLDFQPSAAAGRAVLPAVD